jgi:hypothetical protein
MKDRGRKAGLTRNEIAALFTPGSVTRMQNKGTRAGLAVHEVREGGGYSKNKTMTNYWMKIG